MLPGKVAFFLQDSIDSYRRNEGIKISGLGLLFKNFLARVGI